jgi:hypothetical protein
MTTPEENLTVAEFHLLRENTPCPKNLVKRQSVNDDEIEVTESFSLH